MEFIHQIGKAKKDLYMQFYVELQKIIHPLGERPLQRIIVLFELRLRLSCKRQINNVYRFHCYHSISYSMCQEVVDDDSKTLDIQLLSTSSCKDHTIRHHSLVPTREQPKTIEMNIVCFCYKIEMIRAKIK